MYAVEPFSGLTPAQQAKVLGGEACMWGEGVNALDFDALAVTKAAAVAERLWVPQGEGTVDDAQERLEEHVCRLNMRGVAAEAVAQNFCLSDVL
jgi:hexosaminidase